MKSINFIERLNLFLEAIYYDAKANENTLLFEYDPTYPETYELDASNVIKVIENISKMFIYSQHNAKILISFKLVSYGDNILFFNVTISSNKPFEHKNEELLNKALEYAKIADISVINDKDDKIILEIKARSVSNANFKNKLSLKDQNTKKYNAIIAYEDEVGFKILYNQLKFIGINVRPSSNYESLKRHVTDGIYKPDLIFVQKKFLDDIDKAKNLLEFKKLKNFIIVAICEGDENFSQELKKQIIILRQPYTYYILNTIFTKFIKTNNGGGDGKIVLKF
ncbi:hypothetical protein KDE13_00835 [Campylobacter sp. faydin G-140]|uniref:hypothetical protein n=1 Tax=Campylobacter anatolicus TaxID=2829105 RepID=UPI001B950928|nr:hypothetical protein [Campylobacter anatolicus]MBR8464906.1 hypothetical protein [Campylobacter anatolicus]